MPAPAATKLRFVIMRSTSATRSARRRSSRKEPSVARITASRTRPVLVPETSTEPTMMGAMIKNKPSLRIG